MKKWDELDGYPHLRPGRGWQSATHGRAGRDRARTGSRRRTASVRAVRGIDVSVAPGETVALLGPNGAGKSTTIDMLLGLLDPDAGSVSVFGTAPKAAVDRGAVGAMLQTGALIRDVKVRELVEMMASLYPTPLSVDDVLELTGIAEIADRRTQKLSGGQTQRVRFAIALVSNPDLLVLDEPTVAMDVEGRHAFWSTMREFAAGGQHDPLRHALPRGGRRLRRPGRADGARLDRRRRAAERDQGDGRLAHDPSHAARGVAGGARGSPGRHARRAPRRGGRAGLQRLRRRRSARCSTPTPPPATSRSAAPGSKRPSCSSPSGEEGAP